MKKLFFANSGFSFTCLLFLLFILLVPAEVSAQQVVSNQNPILFHGFVVDAVTQNPLEGVQYYSDRQSSTDGRGLFSFYAHSKDTVIFRYSGYRDFFFIVSDTLRANEYTAGIFMNPDTLMISEVVILPRIGNLKAEIMAKRSTNDFETVNAINNLKVSAYQGIAGINKTGDPAANYEILRQKQKIDAFEKGGIPSDKMVGLNPFIALPVIYMFIKGFPQNPEPPTPYLTPKEIREIKDIHQSLISKGKSK